jgi:peroxiredoxin family protein
MDKITTLHGGRAPDGSHQRVRSQPIDEPLNLVLFSGTDDKLQAAAVLTAGAAALGKPVNVFLQYWALDAFRADRIHADHGLSPEAGGAGREAVDALRGAGQASWAETMRQAKDLGAVDIQACSLSMDLLRIEPTDLDPLVDGVEGVTSFFLAAGDGHLVFI